MMDPQQARQIMQALTGNAGADNRDLETRARQGQLTFRATIKALQSQCSCEPCLLLREALAVMMGEVPGEVTPSAHSVSAQPPANSPIS